MRLGPQPWVGRRGWWAWLKVKPEKARAAGVHFKVRMVQEELWAPAQAASLWPTGHSNPRSPLCAEDSDLTSGTSVLLGTVTNRSPNAEGRAATDLSRVPLGALVSVSTSSCGKSHSPWRPLLRAATVLRLE